MENDEDKPDIDSDHFSIWIKPDPEKFDGNKHEITIKYENERYCGEDVMVIQEWHLNNLIKALQKAKDELPKFQ